MKYFLIVLLLLLFSSYAQAYKFTAIYDGKIWIIDNSLKQDSGRRSASKIDAKCVTGLYIIAAYNVGLIQMRDSKDKPIRCSIIK